jgi:hypothetical protein
MNIQVLVIVDLLPILKDLAKTIIDYPKLKRKISCGIFISLWGFYFILLATLHRQIPTLERPVMKWSRKSLLHIYI